MQFLQIVPIYNVHFLLWFTQVNDVILKNNRLQNCKSIFLSWFISAFNFVQLLFQVSICKHTDFNWILLKIINLSSWNILYMFFSGMGIRMIEPVYLSPSFDNVLPSHLFLQVCLLQK